MMITTAPSVPVQPFGKLTMKAGFKTVSCATDPYDLRPALDVLQDEITRRAQNGPVVVLMGECHAMFSHMALRQGVLARLLGSTSPSVLQPANRLAYGMEYPHNALEEVLAKEALGSPIRQAMRGKISAADRDGVRLLQALQAASVGRTYVPDTNKNFWSFLQHHSVSVRCNDAACQDRESDFFLDQTDRATQDLVAQHAHDQIGKDISTKESLGMSLRNRMIVARSLQHMQDNRADIYIQDCGMDHVFGRKTEDLSYRDSLSFLYNAAGVDVLPVYIDDQYNPSRSPPSLESVAQDLLRDKGIVVEGVSGKRFLNTSPRKLESAYLKLINQHSGGEVTIFAQENLAEKLQLREKLRADLVQWVYSEQAKIQPPLI